jgi:hypothetical protein
VPPLRHHLHFPAAAPISRKIDMLHNDLVVLVDEDDREHGHEGKLVAHRNGLRHRAVSGFVFSKEGNLLIQRRAFSKYHSGEFLLFSS